MPADEARSIGQQPTSRPDAIAIRRFLDKRLEILEALAALPLFDALRALMACLPDGGGLDDALTLVAAPAVFIPALLRARAKVAEAAESMDSDERTGALAVHRALEAPTRLIADNAGLEGAVMVQRVQAEKGPIGLNAATGEMEDLVKAGVIDPAKVTRAALQNAASIAGLLLTTEVLVADKPEEGGAGGGAPDMGGMGGMGGMM